MRKKPELAISQSPFDNFPPDPLPLLVTMDRTEVVDGDPRFQSVLLSLSDRVDAINTKIHQENVKKNIKEGKGETLTLST